MTHLDDTNWFDPVEVANEAIAAAGRIGSPISHLKLQKLLYIAHGIHLAAFGEGLVKGGFQAWQFGPVSPAVYQAAKHFGAYDLPGELGHGRRLPEGDPRTPTARDAVEAVVKHYKDASAIQLVELTHRPDTPWHQVVSQAKGIPWARRIPDQAILEFYQD